MKEIIWKNQINGSRGRQAILILIDQNSIHTFEGKDIEGVVVVKGQDYTKDGKWSHDTFRLVIPDHIRAISFYEGWHTATIAEGLAYELYGARRDKNLDTWGDFANTLNVSVAEAKRWLQSIAPAEAEAITKKETLIGELEDRHQEGFHIIRASIGTATWKWRKRGHYWWPFVIRNKQGEEVARIERDKETWEWSVTRGQDICHLLRVVHESGTGEGYYTLTIILPEDCSIEREIREDAMPRREEEVTPPPTPSEPFNPPRIISRK